MGIIQCQIIFLLIVIISTQDCDKENENNYIYHLSTKTPYRFVANKEDKEFDHKDVKGCTPQKIWMVVRHGTRNPSANFIEKMQDRLPEIRDLIIESNAEPNELLKHSDLDALRKWKLKIQVADEKKLTHEGENEMLLLAERMQTRFPKILPPIYSNTSYYFKATATQRTRLSAKYFAAGLFGRQTVKDVWFPKGPKHDPTLRFYKLCNRWQAEVKSNPDTLVERKKFENSLHMLDIVKKMNQVLNLGNELTVDDIYLMYLTCAFETAWNQKRKSPWCSVFSPNSFKVPEFAEDLKYYYRDGYAYELTYKQACKMFNDAISYFDNTSKFPKATVYFTHSGTILKLLAHLGLYKDDEHLKHTHFEKYDRKWKVSKIDPFGSNVAFVLFKCEDTRKVAVFHQERLMQLPNGETLSDFDSFKKHYNDSINNCLFDEFCSISQ